MNMTILSTGVNYGFKRSIPLVSGATVHKIMVFRPQIEFKEERQIAWLQLLTLQPSYRAL